MPPSTAGYTPLPTALEPTLEPETPVSQSSPRFFTSSRLMVGFGLLFLSGMMLSVLSSALPTNLSSRGVLIKAAHGAVSTENKLCSDIGVQILVQGGSAVDAAIAATLCIGTVNMYSSGIGGGGFAIVKSANGQSEAIDFREEAPQKSFTEMYQKNPKDAQIGGLSVGIPGELRGLEVMYKKHGKLPWDKLVEPSIKLAREGWTVSTILANRLQTAKSFILNDTVLSSIFTRNGALLVEGDHINREKYAITLQAIAQGKADAFYTGPIADSLISFINAKGGIMTHKDFISYKAKVQKPVEGFYHGRKVITTPLPSSGPVLLSLLNILEGFESFHLEQNTVRNMHRLLETFKYVYGQRSFYGDPVDKIYRNISNIMELFTTKDFASSIRANISDKQTFPPEHYNPKFDIKTDHGTMHVSVMLSDGSAVSLTSTINLLFGSRLMEPNTGIILNDEMDDFSIPGISNAFGLAPSPYNYVQPGKRPLSSCVPTIIEKDGKLELVVGASGGSRIITSTANVIVNVLDFGKNPLEAVSDPRAHHQLLPNVVVIENEFDLGLEKELQGIGHNTSRMGPGVYLTGVQVIQRHSDGIMEAAGDWRKGGEAAGY